MKQQVCYRLPHSQHFVRLTQHKGNPQQFTSLALLNGKTGFVIAPFNATPSQPIWLLQPDEEEILPLCTDDATDNEGCNSVFLQENNDGRAVYEEAFDRFHNQLCTNNFAKIVLARSETWHNMPNINAQQLFLKACKRYPRLFVVLITLPQTGTWIMATPEILLSGNTQTWHTMALAGTMKLSHHQLNFDNPPTLSATHNKNNNLVWSRKNQAEQQMVAQYIGKALTPFATNIVQTAPYSARAGSLVHLRSDFSFNLTNPQTIGNLLEALHPTPAVCGLPKHETMSFILDNEPTQRGYYSGFVGMLQPYGNTFLYVSLRCMQFTAQQCTFFAGGGLLKESCKQAEWEETCAKMETMKQLF